MYLERKHSILLPNKGKKGKRRPPCTADSTLLFSTFLLTLFVHFPWRNCIPERHDALFRSNAKYMVEIVLRALYRTFAPKRHVQMLLPPPQNFPMRKYDYWLHKHKHFILISKLPKSLWYSVFPKAFLACNSLILKEYQSISYLKPSWTHILPNHVPYWMIECIPRCPHWNSNEIQFFFTLFI